MLFFHLLFIRIFLTLFCVKYHVLENAIAEQTVGIYK